MNLPLQMGAVFRGGPTALQMSRRVLQPGRVLPASHVPASNRCTNPNFPKMCTCGSNLTEYSCVRQADQCSACGANDP
jgi:hypothetical protein